MGLKKSFKKIGRAIKTYGTTAAIGYATGGPAGAAMSVGKKYASKLAAKGQNVPVASPEDFTAGQPSVFGGPLAGTPKWALWVGGGFAVLLVVMLVRRKK